MHDHAGGRLPQPVANLAVIGLHIIRLGDVHVIEQAVEKLRAVGLRIDRLQLDAFDVGLLRRAVGLRLHVQPARALPHAGQGGEHGAQRRGGVGRRMRFGHGGRCDGEVCF